VTRTVRTATEADVPAIVAVINEATPAIPVDDAEVRTWLTSPEEIDFAVVADERGDLLAYADLSFHDAGSGRAWVDLHVPPRPEADETIAAVLDWAEATARGRGLGLLRVDSSPGSRVGTVLVARGYRPARHFFRMRIDLAAPPPEPDWPDGITVDSPARGEERAVFDAVEDAFADHWEWVPARFEDWAHHLVESEAFDASLWLVARDGEEIAGVCICRYAPGQPELGWVRELGVRRPWRRRGLGTALLLGAFGLFWERGAKAVGLGVDGENTTGAVGLYERAGMRVFHRFDIYEKELT